MAAPAGIDVENLEEKKILVSDKLQKRDEERKAEALRRREERSNITSEQESAKFFTDNFSKEKLCIENELANCDSLSRQEMIDKFDSISLMHQQLQKFVAESAMFLPSYEIRQAQAMLSKLQSDIQEKRDELLPKKKFAFKSKKKGAGTVKEVKPTDEKHSDSLQVILAECKFIDIVNQILQKNEEEINQKDVALANLDLCTVKLLGAPSAIHINKLNNCRVFSGPVSGSIFITECKNCTFVVPCQQLRIHTTTDCKFYIHVTSRAIIEDCSQVQFGEYKWTYPDLDAHYKLSGLDKQKNSWNDIDDFNWLAVDAHSPNWSLIPDEEQIKFWKIL